MNKPTTISTTTKRPIRVLFDAAPLLHNKTGIAYYTERIITQLAQKYPDELELIGVYYNFLGRQDISKLPTAKNLRFVHAPSIIPSKVIFQLRRWGIEFPIELIARTRADFIFYPNILGAPSLFRTPSAPVIHDLTYVDLPQYVSKKLRSDLTRFIPQTIARAKFIVTVSEFGKQRIHEEFGVPLHDIIVTPIPPDTPVLHDKSTQTTALQAMGIDKPFLLALGTIEPRKNLGKLIDGYKTLPQKTRDQYALVIVGRMGWYFDAEEAAIKQAVRDGYNVQYLGYVDETQREILLQAATLFVMASHYEGFGMPILEAMSYGTPCAISDIPVFHEVAGTSAEYFDQENPAEISRHIELLLSNKQQLEKLGHDADAQAKSFKWDTVAQAVYNRIRQTVAEQ